MKYNVGDKVKVRSDLSEKHGACQDMIDKWAGKVVTISEVEPDTIFGKMTGCYHIEENISIISGIKYLWSDIDFEGLAESEEEVDKPTIPPMPPLTTGMFGVEHDDEKFVIVGDNVVYQNSGLCEDVKTLEKHPNLVKALYESQCFKQIDNGDAKVIWENPDSHGPESEDDFELDSFLDFLDKLVKDIKEDKE